MYTLYREKNTGGVSLNSFYIQAISYALYITHGVYTKDDALSYGMVPALAQNIILIAMYWYYRDKVEEPPIRTAFTQTTSICTGHVPIEQYVKSFITHICGIGVGNSGSIAESIVKKWLIYV